MGGNGESRLRLGIVDDHAAIRSGIIAVLQDLIVDLDVVSAPTVRTLLEESVALDMVLLDVQLGDGVPPAANVRELKALGWPVLLYTQETSVPVVAACLRAGAFGIVSKSEDLCVLTDAVRKVAAGEHYYNGDWAAAVEADFPVEAPALAARELEALRLYSTGLPLKSVARRMGVRPDTAKEYLDRVRRKYAEAGRPAPTKVELRIRAVEDGLLTQEHDMLDTGR